MKRIVAALLTFIFIQSSIAGICIPAFASESLGTEVSESFSEADIPAESALSFQLKKRKTPSHPLQYIYLRQFPQIQRSEF